MIGSVAGVSIAYKLYSDRQIRLNHEQQEYNLAFEKVLQIIKKSTLLEQEIPYYDPCDGKPKPAQSPIQLFVNEIEQGLRK